MEEETEHWGTLEEKHGSGPMLSFTVSRDIVAITVIH